MLKLGVFCSLVFPNMFSIEARDFSGGMWCFWDASRITLEVSFCECAGPQGGSHGENSGEVVHFCGLCFHSTDTQGGIVVFFEEAWAESMAAWILLRDFNQPLSPEDKKGGAKYKFGQAQKLGEVLQQCNMLDLGISGPKFTWINSRKGRAKIRFESV